MIKTPETAMLSPDRLPDLAPLAAANDDYAVVRRAIAYISEHWQRPARDRADRPLRSASRRTNCITCSAAGPG